MPPVDPDAAIRLAAFRRLRDLVARHGAVLPWRRIAEGFTYAGRSFHFANRARGIFRPVGMKGAALSIKTTVPRRGRRARYDDEVASDAAFFGYRYQGTDPASRDNRLLREAARLGAPLIYFYGVAPTWYHPLWPVYVTGWDDASRTFFIAVDRPEAVDARATGEAPPTWIATPEPRRRIAILEARRRLHRAAFRRLVLTAYEERCAVCDLHRAELLDAARILPERERRGHLDVPEGIALCALHHRAFDRHLIGIRPEGVVEVARRARTGVDDPVFRRAILDLQGKPIRVPRDPALRPRGDHLATRFAAFRAAG